MVFNVCMGDLNTAITSVGGPSNLARQLGVSPQRVTNWTARGRVPVEMCPPIERLTGVRCEDLRPDIDWAVLRRPARKRAAT
jgi:DNA-binding transcriptional regulator YdaS (Cro superfamily)